MPAVLFGSIGTIADTSELQREAFNEAFREHGLDWHWSREEYQRLLEDSGGARRIAAYAESQGDEVDAAAVHRTKSRIFQEKLRASHVAPRPGLVDTLAQVRSNGYKLGLVTTTSAENITALTEAMRPQIDIESFDLIVDSSSVERSKPDPEAYRFALARLDEKPHACLAVEDNVGGVQAAVSAGLTCVVFPGENNAEHGFDGAAERVDRLAFAELRTLFPAA
jgi:HAD superfamily hydrolase (TIGR01509 family)